MTDEAMRPWYKKKRWMGAMALAALVAIALATGDGGDDGEVASATTDTTEPDGPAGPTSTTEPSTTTTSETTTTTTTAAPQWTEVARLDGVEGKQGDTFALTSGRQRLRYESEAAIFAVYVMEEGKSLDQDGGIPDTMCSEPCADETNLRKSPGDYYFDVRAANGAWSVVIEEMR